MTLLNVQKCKLTKLCILLLKLTGKEIEVPAALSTNNTIQKLEPATRAR